VSVVHEHAGVHAEGYVLTMLRTNRQWQWAPPAADDRRVVQAKGGN
jgi:hypothetical protein